VISSSIVAEHSTPEVEIKHRYIIQTSVDQGFKSSYRSELGEKEKTTEII